MLLLSSFHWLAITKYLPHPSLSHHKQWFAFTESMMGVFLIEQDSTGSCFDLEANTEGWDPTRVLLPSRSLDLSYPSRVGVLRMPSRIFNFCQAIKSLVHLLSTNLHEALYLPVCVPDTLCIGMSLRCACPMAFLIAWLDSLNLPFSGNRKEELQGSGIPRCSWEGVKRYSFRFLIFLLIWWSYAMYDLSNWQ